MDVLNIVFSILSICIALAIAYAIIRVVFTAFTVFLPAIIGAMLSGLLWSVGHDNIAVIIIIVFAFVELLWRDWIEK